MGWLLQEVLKSSAALGYEVTVKSAEETAALRQAIIDSYTTPYKSSFRLWEQLDNALSIHDAEIWRELSMLLPDEAVTLFFDPFNEQQSLMMSSHAVTPILGECVGFVFYLTNSTLDYILCMNDHDFLIAAGAATSWLTDGGRIGRL